MLCCRRGDTDLPALAMVARRPIYAVRPCRQVHAPSPSQHSLHAPPCRRFIHTLEEDADAMETDCTGRGVVQGALTAAARSDTSCAPQPRALSACC